MAYDAALLDHPDQGRVAAGIWRLFGVDVVRIRARWSQIAPGAKAPRPPAGFRAGRSGRPPLQVDRAGHGDPHRSLPGHGRDPRGDGAGAAVDERLTVARQPPLEARSPGVRPLRRRGRGALPLGGGSLRRVERAQPAPTGSSRNGSAGAECAIRSPRTSTAAWCAPPTRRSGPRTPARRFSSVRLAHVDGTRPGRSRPCARSGSCARWRASIATTSPGSTAGVVTSTPRRATASRTTRWPACGRPMPETRSATTRCSATSTGSSARWTGSLRPVVCAPPPGGSSSTSPTSATRRTRPTPTTASSPRSRPAGSPRRRSSLGATPGSRASCRAPGETSLCG